MQFIVKHKLIHKNQCGGQKGNNTNNALAHLTGYIYEKINYNKCVAATFIDLSEAFDTVNHFILLKN